MTEKECKHSRIKFFPKKNRIICLDCGEDWSKQVETVFVPYSQPVYLPPVQPYAPNIWPNITCSGNTIKYAQLPDGTQMSWTASDGAVS